jgi:tripartite-type tricarboxylate transporter receptor subunit TctC
MLKNLVIIIVAILFLEIISVQYSHGKEYPTKPIEIFVPYGAGGSLDLGARLIAEIAKKYLGQPLIVLNKVGAGGTVAATEVFNSKPDGYKILYFANNFFVTTIKTQKIPFDPTYFVPLANFTEERMGLIVRKPLVNYWNTADKTLVN